MKRLLLMLTWLFAVAMIANSQTVLEDFEGGAKLQWNNNAGDSTLTVVDKPAGGDTLNINSSAKVGSYTKVAGKGYSLLIATLSQPLNLTTNNQFRIQVKSPVRTSFILKLEGNGEFIEETKKIGVANQWIEYTFNFSAAKNMTTLNKIILFFDPGVDASSDTYLFDNLIQEGGACAGVAKNADIIDDFECQRNGVYGDPGYLDIAAVDNPDKSGINTSDRVGKYTDRNGSFHAMVIPFANPIALTAERNQVKIKVWAPKTGRLLVKLEGGGSPAKEKDAQVTEVNKWVEYTIDFSDQAGANHRSLVFFFNAGVEMAAGDIYYIDDIQITKKSVPAPLEDFEPAAKLAWESLGNEAIFGTFGGAIDNPDKTGVNTTNKVGKYTKGSSKLGGLKAAISSINLTDFPQIDLQVWAPAGAKNLTLQLSSPTQGLKEVTRPIAETGKWVQLSFNFDAFKTITDFEAVNIVFDKDLASTDMWFFDNLLQGGATVDPCEGTVKNNNFVDDFDCQRNSTVNNSALKIINNPDASGINPNPLDKVGEYTDPINEPFAALVFRRDTAYNLTNTNQLYVKIWSSKVVPIGFKLEGGTSPAVEIVRNVTRTNEWVEYVVDFSGQAAANHKAVVIFFNFGVNNPDADKYYIDDVEWRRAPYKSCIVTFETPDLTLTNWKYFANGALENDPFSIVDNPNTSGANLSAKVGLFKESNDGEVFAGMFSDLPAPLELGASRTVKMKVLGPVANSYVMKMEGAVGTALNSGDVRASYTTPGQWQELTWDFSKTQGGQNIAVGSQYTRVTMIPDIDNKPPTVRNYYFDDITVGEGSCGTTGIFDPIVVEALKIMPNPVYNELTVQNADKINLFVIYNAMGQRLSVVQPNGITNLAIPVEHLQTGVYILAGYDASGMLIANARFVKQ